MLDALGRSNYRSWGLLGTKFWPSAERPSSRLLARKFCCNRLNEGRSLIGLLLFPANLGSMPGNLVLCRDWSFRMRLLLDALPDRLIPSVQSRMLSPHFGLL